MLLPATTSRSRATPMNDRMTKALTAKSGGDLRAFTPGAAAVLRARGVPLSRRRVSSLARLARSFARDGMGRFEALHLAGALIARRR
jgi:hypothetical protein